MKVVRKLKCPLIRDNGIECTKEIVVNDALRQPLADLVEFDGRILEPIPITESQSVFFSSCGRTFFLVSYLPQSVLQFACESCGADKFAFILHNKDFTENGELKKAHFHVLLHFEQRTYITSLVYWFRSTEARIVSTESVFDELNYLTHNSEKCRKEHKVSYDYGDIVSNDLTYWENRSTPIGSSDNEDAVALVKDFFDSKLNHLEMVKKHGFRYLTYYRTLESMFNSERFIQSAVDTRLRYAEAVKQSDGNKKPVLIDYGGQHLISNVPDLDGIERAKK